MTHCVRLGRIVSYADNGEMGTQAENRRYYAKNKERYTAAREKQRAMVRARINEVKANSVCHCGERDPACLLFHHRDPSEKDLDVSLASRHCWSLARLEREIAKCDIICANCHLKLHARLRALSGGTEQGASMSENTSNAAETGTVNTLWVYSADC